VSGVVKKPKYRYAHANILKINGAIHPIISPDGRDISRPYKGKSSISRTLSIADVKLIKNVFVISFLLTGAWLRFHALMQDVRFQPDEALFSTFARGAAINGDWMLPGALDKPPLAIYANALSMVVFGESEFAARLPGTVASIFLMVVMGRLGRDLYTDQTDAIYRVPTELSATLLISLSPYAIAFSATALTDGLMLMFMVLALSMAVRGRWGWSGLCLGLAFASKQQAMFYLPLILLLGRVSVTGLMRFGITLAMCAGVLILWDTARGETSIFALAAYNNDPARLIRSSEILPRLHAWLNFGKMLLGEGWVTASLIGTALITLAVRVRQRTAVVDVLLLTWLTGYFGLHWLVAFNTYDRYLLPALPVVILLVSRGIGAIFNRKLHRQARANPYLSTALSILLVMLLAGAWNASEGRAEINNDGEAYDGIDRLADYLNSKPVATVVYDRWLGWELGYYMGQWTDKRRVYYHTPDLLAQGALSLCEMGIRYLPAPSDQPVRPYLEALREAGFRVELTYSIPRFVVYGIIPPAAEDASDAATSSPDHLVWCADELR
jgi:hypothetical protein